MKLKVITTVSTKEHPGLKKLEHSLKYFNYDYHIIENKSIGWDWSGWDNTYRYCKEIQNDYTHIIYTDGFDTFALGDQRECELALEEILEPNPSAFVYSTEKHFFPHEGNYQEVIDGFARIPFKPEQRWRFANGGQYAGSIQAVMKWYENAPKDRNNQSWANEVYIMHNADNKLILDTGCKLFQSVAFTTWQYEDGTISGGLHNSLDEFGREGNRIVNKLLNTKAPLLHANGAGTDFEFVYQCLT